MFDYSNTELANIDTALEPKLAWAAQKMPIAEQLAMDSTRLLSCTSDRLDDYKKTGFFKRCWGTLSGKQGEITRANQSDLIEMQKNSWRYLDLLQERDLMLAHSMITIKNGLSTLAIKEEETRNQITRMAEVIHEKFLQHEERFNKIEAEMNIHSWLLTLETLDYDEKFSPNFRLLKVASDFFDLKGRDWNIKEIRYLHKAIKEVSLPWKDSITIDDFICGIIDEIEDSSIDNFQTLTALNSSNSRDLVPDSFIMDNISVSSYKSLKQVSHHYESSSIAIEALADQLDISRTEALKKILQKFIVREGTDLNVGIPMRDLAVELVASMHLSIDLFDISPINNNQKTPTSSANICPRCNDSKPYSPNAVGSNVADLCDNCINELSSSSSSNKNDDEYFDPEYDNDEKKKSVNTNNSHKPKEETISSNPYHRTFTPPVGAKSFVIDDSNIYPVLTKATGDELSLLAKVICGKTSSSITEHCKSPYDIASEIQLMGGNSIVNLTRGHGVNYREVALDIADKLGVKNVDDNDPIHTIEWGVLKKLLSNFEEKMSEADKKKFYNDLNDKAQEKYGDDVAGGFKFGLGIGGGFNTYTYMLILEFILPSVLRTLGLNAAAGFLGGRAAAAFIPVVGWALAGSSLVLTLAATAYSVTIPCVAIVGAIRARLTTEQSA